MRYWQSKNSSKISFQQDSPPRENNSCEPQYCFGEGKRWNEFAEWHVAWFAE